MSHRPIRVGIVGAGWWAFAAHMPALKRVPGVEVVAACRRDPDQLADFARKAGVPQTYTNHGEMLDDAKLDAVIVCTPHALHYRHVKAALERGLPVLTDKPLAIRSADGEELVALAEAKGVPLAVYFGHAYDPCYRYAAAQIRSGGLGRLVHVSCTGFANPDALGFFGNAEFEPDHEEFPIVPTQFRADPALGGGGYLQDVGNHCFSALLIGTGLDVVEVSAQMDDPQLDLRANITLRFRDGAMGNVLVIGDLRPPTDKYFGVGHYSATGDMAGLWRSPGDAALWRQEWCGETRAVAEAELPPKSSPDANFIAAIRGEAPLIAPGSEALKCVRAIEAAYQAARTGKTVRLA
ncbi:MAG TPA: Gfo/Idh/MocA family oxidoreductase [Chthonomonadaceae bacterium]|nr:Gfo/Idh/MocA family oxidoreductase [Chthonomonadaceae bacterium]